MPAGFDYRTELVSREAEKELLAEFANLPFKPFEFREAEALPSFLSATRDAATGLAA